MLQTAGTATPARPGLPRVSARDWLPDGEAPQLDDAHAAVWDAIRDLFPRAAMVDQPDAGLLLVSWPLATRRRKGTQFALPLMLRIPSGLLLALWASSPDERGDIGRAQREVVRAALAVHDPASRIPALPVIVLGEELLS